MMPKTKETAKRLSIFKFMLLSLGMLFLVLAVSVAFFTYRNLTRLLYREYYLRLESAGMLMQAFLPKESEELREKAEEIIRTIGTEESIRITFIDSEGTVFADSHEDPQIMENHAGRPEIKEAFSGAEKATVRKSPTLSIPMFYHAFPLQDRSGEVFAVLRLSIPSENLENLVSTAAWEISLITFVLLAAAIAAMVLVSRKITVPLSKIAKSAAAYADYDFSSPMNIEGPLEISTTADALQSMARSLTSRIGEVTRQKQELEAVLTGMNEAVIVLDRNLVITEVNPSAGRLFGASTEPMPGKSLIQLIHNTELDDFAREALASRGISQCSIVLPGRGTETYLQVNASTIEAVVETAEGETRIQRLILVMNDITTLKKLEEVRKEFVANVSHELKTPITSIKGFVETLLDGAIDDRENAQRFLEIIEKQTSRIGNIVEDLLTLSRLEQSKDSSRFPFEPVTLSRTAYDAIAVCKNRADEKSIAVTNGCYVEPKVWGNPRLMEQAVVNLVDNAIKYCPEGSEISLYSEAGKKGIHTLVIRDNGPGIPQKDQSRIFERFYRVEKARSRDMGGTGLGLAIVKHIMLIHGGSVTLESRRGEGTAFFLHFPIQNSNS
ncbi:MAG: ATP-binding protein [Spirochaetaceae bacterium]